MGFFKNLYCESDVEYNVLYPRRLVSLCLYYVKPPEKPLRVWYARIRFRKINFGQYRDVIVGGGGGRGDGARIISKTEFFARIVGKRIRHRIHAGVLVVGDSCTASAN